MKLSNGKQLINEAKRIQKKFLKVGTYWSLSSCLDSLIENDTIETNKEAIDDARLVAIRIDEEFANEITFLN